MNDDLRRVLKQQVGGTHYKGFAIQPMEYCHVNGIPYIDGNVIKYVSRWRQNGGEGLQDLEKALHYLQYLIADEKAKLPPPPSRIKTMAPALDENGEPFRPGTPEDGGHHARQSDEDEHHVTGASITGGHTVEVAPPKRG